MPFWVMLHSSSCCSFWKPYDTVGGEASAVPALPIEYFLGGQMREDLSFILYAWKATGFLSLKVFWVLLNQKRRGPPVLSIFFSVK